MGSTELYGLILNGGKSSRMGTSKGLLNYHGSTQLHHLFQLLSNYCSQVFVSVKEFDQSLPFPQIADAYQFSTPLNGISSAFHQNPDRNWLVVPIDMPLITAFHLEQLINENNSNSYFTGYKDSEGTLPEPLFGIWNNNCFSELMNFIENDNSPRKFLLNSPVHLLKIDRIENLMNGNTPEQRMKIQKTLSNRKNT